MSFSYQYGANPPIDYVRFLIPDTVDLNHIFEDQEITMATTMQSLVWQSSMFYSGVAGQTTLPTPPVSYARIAAMMIDALANDRARLASVKRILDVELDPATASKMLRDGAQCLRDQDDEGAFVIIEQVQTGAPWSFRDRWWAQIQRQSA